MEYITVLTHVVGAAIAGALIGLERTYHGRPAGFRTHILVCMASSLLMLLGTAEAAKLSGLPIDAVRVDPARMGQGIMTGIGFLGAGVIMKEGLSVRGLTTAASIWITAAIGILLGSGFYFAAVVGTIITLLTLSLFRWIESLVPTRAFARLRLTMNREAHLTEEGLRIMIARHNVGAARSSYRVSLTEKSAEYEVEVHTRRAENFRQLADALAETQGVREFTLTPAGEK
jgi:putative Mg2+ transporter-C (MgtC) family protein